jgi:hypothetical protein
MRKLFGLLCASARGGAAAARNKPSWPGALGHAFVRNHSDGRRFMLAEAGGRFGRVLGGLTSAADCHADDVPVGQTNGSLISIS